LQSLKFKYIVVVTGDIGIVENCNGNVGIVEDIQWILTNNYVICFPSSIT
jgi:hypothetical protein